MRAIYFGGLVKYFVIPHAGMVVRSFSLFILSLILIDIYSTIHPDINEPPYNIQISNSAVEENSDQDVVIGNITCQDPDEAQSHSFVLIDGAFGRYKLVNGQIKTSISNTACLSHGGDFCELNYEKHSYHVVRVRSTDNGVPPQSVEADLTIHIIDINDRPRDLKLTNHFVKENATVNTLIGKFSASDEDTRQVSLRYFMLFFRIASEFL